jgi:hypothetical protein
MSYCCGHVLGSATYGLYNETPIKAHATADQGMVSLILGQQEQLRLDFMDPDPLHRFVAAAKEARRLFRATDHCPRESQGRA